MIDTTMSGPATMEVCSPVSLEICVDSATGLAAAIAGGAHRVELCAALGLGGLTPSMGLMRLAARSPLPVFAMIRPRAGGFIYDQADVDQMLLGIEAARDAGLAGVVLGASKPSGALDDAVLGRLLDRARGLGATLHRAFDLAPEPLVALETAIGLGFERILSSGGAATALEGVATLAALNRQAAGRIAIMPGVGVNAANAEMIVRGAQVQDLHASCGASVAADPHAQRFGYAPNGLRQTREDLVQALAVVLTRIVPGREASIDQQGF